MSFTLHLFFAGLIAFVPSHDGDKLTVLVPNASHGHTLSNESQMPPHQALLVARAAGCQGSCGVGDSRIAGILFADQADAKAPDELTDAIQQGAAWLLEGVEVSIVPQKGTLKIVRDLRKKRGDATDALPQTCDEGKDFSWVADLGRLVPGFSGAVDPALLAPSPCGGRLSARMELQSGTVRAYHLVRVPKGVPALRFQTLDGQPAAAGSSQALADWVMVEVQVSGAGLTLETSRFGTTEKRFANLSPDHGLLEIAILNVPTSRANADVGGPGTHFAGYYDLAKDTPTFRPVPYVSHVGGIICSPKTRSGLLEALRLNDPRGVYDRLICPLAQLRDGKDVSP